MAVNDHPLLGLGYGKPVSAHPLIRLSDDGATNADADIAEEVPIALVYNGRPHVVVMGTPADLEDLAVGFTITERVVDTASAIERIDVVKASHGVELQIQIPAASAERLTSRGRGMVSRTGCGLCGVETIDEALRLPTMVGNTLRVEPAALWLAASALSARQEYNSTTNTVHAAGWAFADGRLHVVREDVGRHNALDKVLGAIARESTGVDATAGFLIVTSRASYELVQKAASSGIELLAAISRPTGLAIRFADAAGVTLVGLLRGRSANVYSGARRILGA